MWYVKDEFSEKIYFKSNDVRKTQSFACNYNKRFKFAGQRSLCFTISDFSGFVLFGHDKVDINAFTFHCSFFERSKFSHPLAIKGYNTRHIRYRDLKFKLVCKLAKKYHLWSYNEQGRKCDGFDF